MKQCMDFENLHRRLKKIIGQVQAIDRMVDEDIPCEDFSLRSTRQGRRSTAAARSCSRGTLSIVSATVSNTATQIRPSRALQKRWNASQICSKTYFQKRQRKKAAFFVFPIDKQYPPGYNIHIHLMV